jgi:uncharacterized protein (DUF849 family)
MPILVKCCLNGGTTREEHAAVPLTPSELAAEARDAVAAGAGALHLHPRDGDGAETLDAAAVDAAVAAVRDACPGIPVGVTTGLWAAGGSVEARAVAVAGWTSRPDFASVNFSEPEAESLSELLLGKGIGVEAGIWTVADAERLAAAGDLAGRCVRVLVEPQEHEPAGALANAEAVRARLAGTEIDRPLLQHGYGPAAWSVLRAALVDGLDVRIGLEDVTTLPDGATPAGNGELVAAAVALADQPGVPGASS